MCPGGGECTGVFLCKQLLLKIREGLNVCIFAEKNKHRGKEKEEGGCSFKHNFIAAGCCEEQPLNV